MGMHGHVEDEILEAIASESGEDLGLEFVPSVVGRADGEPPAASRGPGFPSTNWAGNVGWRADEVAAPEAIEELEKVAAARHRLSEKDLDRCLKVVKNARTELSRETSSSITRTEPGVPEPRSRMRVAMAAAAASPRARERQAMTTAAPRQAHTAAVS